MKSGGPSIERAVAGVELLQQPILCPAISFVRRPELSSWDWRRLDMRDAGKHCFWRAAALGVAVWVCACTPPAKQQSEAGQSPPVTGEIQLTAAQAAQVRIAVVAMNEIGARIVTPGRVTYNDLLVSHITSPVSGRLTQIIGQFGQQVRCGAPLAVIVSPDMGIASSDVDKAEADLNQTALDLERQKRLLAAHAVPERDYENAVDNHERAKTEYERANKKMTLFSADPNATVSQNYTLRSAIDGEIISRTAFLGAEIQGQYAGGNTNDLFVVADLREVWVMGDIHEADIGRVKVGQRVQLIVEGVTGEIFEGSVDWVADILDPTTRTARVRCVVQNPRRRLKPDMFASMTIEAPGRQALTLPRSAVVRLGDKTVVFVPRGDRDAEGRRFVRRPVIVDDDPAEQVVAVTHGLEAGEKVVVSGTKILAEQQ
jgi:cobalt-zinc-cadmium efflux system membrane fusion protein